MHRLLITAAAGILLSACSTEAKKMELAAPAPSAKAPAASAVAVPPAATVETAAQRMARTMQSLASKSIYFDYDDFSIKPQYQVLIKQDSELMLGSAKLTLTLLGNADERGSAEYNLALGQKRAESVKRTLKMLGIPEGRLEAVSYGNEKPRATCHEEKCWAENRRVDFVAKPNEGAK